MVRLVRRHWPLLVLLTAGIAVRVITLLAYQPALLYIDSYRYLDNLQRLDPTQLDPIGYDLVLRALIPLGGLRSVVIVQHAVGVGMAFAIYALALRHGARRWLAALATAPVLLDAYQVQIEQNVMSDIWLQALLVGALWLLVSRAAPGPLRAAVAGLLLAIAVVMRTVALPAVLPAVAYLVVAGGAWRTKAGWRKITARAGALLICFGFVLFCYAGYFHREAGHWGLTGSTGDVLYGRTAEVANCDALHLDPLLQQMCPIEPLSARKGVDYYSHVDGDPRWPGFVPSDTTVPAMQRQFALAVLRAQPWDVVGGVLTDFGKGFALGRTSAPTDVPVYRWQFQTVYPIWSGPAAAIANDVAYGGQPPTVYPRLAAFLRDYQLGGGYTPGPALALCGIMGLVGGFGARRRSGIRAATMLVTGLAGTVLFVSAMFEFSWRYQLPGLVLLPLAGVLGLTVLIGPLRRPKGKARRKMLAPFPDPVDERAIDEFTERHGRPAFAPVLVVIAAYNEEDGIGGVLDNLPQTCLDLPVDVLVVVDGCSDGTATEAIKHGAYTCIAPENRGQGAALRLGYQLAAFGGAQYVITTDADGQYDNAEMPLLLGPLLAGTHDFVTGSRRLGVAPSDDRVRWLGVRVYAALASTLTMHKITDTSFGFRGMRTELACSVRLRQPQYQASELLLGALAGGARLLEQPMTMRIRSAGTTKKGNNFVYGVRYGSVMTWTWMREYVGRRALRLVGVGRQRVAVAAEQASQTP
ncbi:MAG TPA: glycosyltransferase family 2 protein [Pseudonocardiaceae bacterium]|nr:glycosyltransferase family 2 protein [Pseudonocardiaceae bacterium]